MKKKTKQKIRRVPLLLFAVGVALLLYCALVTSQFGEVNFIPMLVLFGCVLVIVATIDLLVKGGILAHVPRWMSFSIKAVLSLLLCSFLFIEALIVCAMRPSDAPSPRYAVVLGAGLINDQITTSLELRLQEALALYQKAPETIFIVSGGIGSYSTIAESTAMKTYLMAQGIPEAQIVEEPYSADTVENLTFSKALLPPNEALRVISSDYHLFRSQLICRDLDLQCVTLPAKTIPLLRPNFMIREYFAILNYWFFQK